MYAPCDTTRKILLWHDLKTEILAKCEDKWCVIGDFNADRNVPERRGSSENLRMKQMEDFDEFITVTNLLDLPLHGRRYTWSRIGGTRLSRIDRF